MSTDSGRWTTEAREAHACWNRGILYRTRRCAGALGQARLTRFGLGGVFFCGACRVAAVFGSPNVVFPHKRKEVIQVLDFDSVDDLFEDDVQNELLTFSCTSSLSCEDD